MGESYWKRLANARVGRRRVLVGAMIASSSLATATLVGCGGEEGTPSPGQSTSAAGGEKRGGTLKVVSPIDEARLDPSKVTTVASIPTEAIYDTLIRPDAGGRLGPGLASKWEASEKTKLVFTLRQGVKFHDGTPFNAEAVKFNLQRHQAKEIASSAAADLAFIDKVDTPDASTVVLSLKEPFSPQLELLGQSAGMIASPAAVRDKSPEDANRNPVGTGPFKLDRWEPSVRQVFSRNTSYWQEGRPFLDGIEMSVIAEAATRIANLESGNVHWIPISQTADFERLKAAGYQANDNMTGGYNAWRPNHQRMFKDKRVRQAVAYALDRPAIVKVAATGTPVGQGVFGPAFKGIGVYDPNFKSPYNLDLNKAKSLLSAAGVPDLKFELSKGSSPDLEPMLQLIQQNLKAAGIQTEIWTAGNQLAQVAQKLYSSSFDAFYTGNVPNPAAPSYRIDSAIVTGGSRNYEQYSNPQVDALFKKAWETYDIDARYKIYREIEPILTEDIYVAVTEYASQRIALAKNVRNWQFYVGGGGMFTNIWLA